MDPSQKTVVYDRDLQIEAYHFQGLAQPFPLHFHAYYVLGLVERGARRLSYQYQETDIHSGDLLLFNPGGSHSCTQSDGGALDYRSVNVSIETMQDLAADITGSPLLPIFPAPVVRDGALAAQLRTLHQLILQGAGAFEKEEVLLSLLSNLLERCGRAPLPQPAECRAEIDGICAFLEQHYPEHIRLDQLCRRAGLSRSTLLRAFTRSKGITPYRYLEAVRIGEAKKLLEQGVPPADAALRTGFSDQSHFTNYFTSFIGLSPGAYQTIFTEKPGGASHGPSE